MAGGVLQSTPITPSWTLTVRLRNPAFSAVRGVPWQPDLASPPPSPSPLYFSVSPSPPPYFTCSLHRSPPLLGLVAPVRRIRSQSKFGHAWRRSRAPAGTPAASSPLRTPYIKLHRGAFLPLLPPPPVSFFSRAEIQSGSNNVFLKFPSAKYSAD